MKDLWTPRRVDLDRPCQVDQEPKPRLTRTYRPKLHSIVLFVFLACLIPAMASANVPYLNGFETDTGDFTGSGTITRVPSYGGTLGVVSNYGAWHAEITNLQDGYSTNFGDSQYTLFGGKVSTYPGQFWQAVDVYIDLSTWVPGTDSSLWDEIAFQIDESPANTSGGSYYAAETNFRFYFDSPSSPTPGVLVVKHHDTGRTIATIDSSTGSGWYTFVITYYKGATTVQNEAMVLAPDGTVLGTDVEDTGAANASLGGSGYLWFTVWQNGFANDIAAIDNARTGLRDYTRLVPPVPALHPFALGLLALLLGLAGIWVVRHQ